MEGTPNTRRHTRGEEADGGLSLLAVCGKRECVVCGLGQGVAIMGTH